LRRSDADANERKPVMPSRNAIRILHLSHTKMPAVLVNTERFYRNEQMLDRIELG
jgi:hypothetical protein